MRWARGRQRDIVNLFATQKRKTPSRLDANRRVHRREPLGAPFVMLTVVGVRSFQDAASLHYHWRYSSPFRSRLRLRVFFS